MQKYIIMFPDSKIDGISWIASSKQRLQLKRHFCFHFYVKLVKQNNKVILTLVDNQSMLGLVFRFGTARWRWLYALVSCNVVSVVLDAGDGIVMYRSSTRISCIDSFSIYFSVGAFGIVLFFKHRSLCCAKTDTCPVSRLRLHKPLY